MEVSIQEKIIMNNNEILNNYEQDLKIDNIFLDINLKFDYVLVFKEENEEGYIYTLYNTKFSQKGIDIIFLHNEYKIIDCEICSGIYKILIKIKGVV